MQQSLPAVELTESQKKALAALEAFIIRENNPDAEALHAKLHALKDEVPIAPKELFQAIYRIFLNRDSGPKAGPFLAGLPRDFVLKRLQEAT